VTDGAFDASDGDALLDPTRDVLLLQRSVVSCAGVVSTYVTMRLHSAADRDRAA
jgi:hypothetical protein